MRTEEPIQRCYCGSRGVDGQWKHEEKCHDGEAKQIDADDGVKLLFGIHFNWEETVLGCEGRCVPFLWGFPLLIIVIVVVCALICIWIGLMSSYNCREYLGELLSFRALLFVFTLFIVVVFLDMGDHLIIHFHSFFRKNRTIEREGIRNIRKNLIYLFISR